MKNKRFIATLLFTFIAAALSAGIWFLVSYKINLEKEQIYGLKKNIAENEEKISNLKSLNAILEETKEDKELVQSVFLTNDQLIRVIESLEFIGKTSSTTLKISSVSSDAAKSSKPSFSFSAEGSFAQVFKFARYLENLPYYFSISRISFNKVNEAQKNSLPQWQAIFNIELESYEKI